MDKRQFWHFSKEKDIEQTADDPASGRPAQPDHFPNVVRPGGGYPEGRGEKTDAFCNKCKDQLIDGSCLRCDWGPQNRSVPVENFPLDPFEDDKAGIRAASWHFAKGSKTINLKGYYQRVDKKEKDRIIKNFVKMWNADMSIRSMADELQKSALKEINGKPVRITVDGVRQFKATYSNLLENLAPRGRGYKHGVGDMIAPTTYGVENIANLYNDFVSQGMSGKQIFHTLTNEPYNIYWQNVKSMYDFLRNQKIKSIVKKRWSPLKNIDRQVLFLNEDKEKILDILELTLKEHNGVLGEKYINFRNNLDKNFGEGMINSLAISKWLDQEDIQNNIKNRNMPFKGYGTYDPLLPGYIYIIQSNEAIKIGISNNIDQRLNAHKEHYNVDERGALNIPEGVANQIALPIITSNNQNTAYVSPVIQDGNIPLLIEKQIVNWWRQDLNLPAGEINPKESILQGSMNVNLVINMVEKLLANYGVASKITEDEQSSLIQTYGPEYFQGQFPSSMGFDLPQTENLINESELEQDPNQMQIFGSKKSDYQGWTNWETWNTKLMIDNDYDPYMQSRQLVQNFTPIDQFAMWATETILAPHNQQALADAQEWNEIPYDERPTGREDMSEGGQALIESFDEIFDMDPRSDETAQIIDESKVNWNEIYNSIGEDIKESERFAHEEGEHDLLVSDYMTEYSAPELAEAQAEKHSWCPVCNVERPDDPGTTTLPPDWA